ncbi:MAG: cytochrome P450 [Acidimicrobiia bacterium]
MAYDINAWLTAQPYEGWARERAKCPVHLTTNPLGGGEMYEVTGYDTVMEVLRDSETFSSSINGEHIGQFMGDLILAMGGKEHRSYRALVSHAFRPSAIERWDAELVQPLITALVGEIAARSDGKAELVAELTSRYPVQVICAIVGVPAEDHDKFHGWANDINTGPLDPERGMAASRAMREYLEPLVAARRAEPTGDLLSELVHAEIDGEQLSDERLYGFLRLLLPAGAETTFRMMGNCLTALLTHPDVLARAYEDRSIIPDVIEETLRWESSVTSVSRVATRDVEVAGCAVTAGSALTVLVGAGDRDPAKFEDPDTWRLDRGSFHHLAFSTGPHQCLGMHLARLELRVGLNTVLDQLPNLRLDPAFPAPVIQGTAFRGPDAVHVLFDPA